MTRLLAIMDAPAGGTLRTLSGGHPVCARGCQWHATRGLSTASLPPAPRAHCTAGSGSGRGQHACKGHPILGHVDIYSTSHRRRGRTTHARAKPFVWGRGPVVGKGPPPGGPQLPGGNLLVYPPDPSSRAGKLLHNRANSELRSLLVGPPTTTTPKLKQARWALGPPVRWEPRHACSHCFGAHLTHRTRLIFSVAAAMKS